MGQSRIYYTDENGNPAGDYLDGEATHVRVYKDEGDHPWHVDAVDDKGNFTEEVSTFATWDEAMAEAPNFVAQHIITEVHVKDGRVQ